MSRFFRHLTLQIETNRACNLDCRICMRRNIEKSNSPLSLKKFKRILDSGNFRYVGLHGWGEPLMNRELFDMIQYAESKGVSTNVTSNGTLLPEHIDDIFESGLGEIAFGVYDLETSSSYSFPHIMELSSEKIRRGTDKPRVYLDIPLYRDNLGEIPEIVRLAPQLQVNAVIIHRLFNVYKVDPTVVSVSDDEERDFFTMMGELAQELGLDIYLPPEHTYPCRIVKRSIFVSERGEVTPCCFLPELSFGNALDEGVSRIIRKKEYRNFVKNMETHQICSKCQW